MRRQALRACRQDFEQLLLRRFSGYHRERNDPRRACQLHGSSHRQRRRAVSGGRPYDGAGVVNRQSGPKTELRVWLMCRAKPITGNRNSATELRINTAPSDTAISSSLAPAIGPTAAIALPPQIAVPALIRNDAFLLTSIR